MPTKIRLQRKGKKGRPFYHIVIADGRAPRDGRVVERIGTYDPMTNPASIELNFEKALHWIQVGAQPTDTARSILAYKGVMYKNHLIKGIEKGALTEEKVEVLFKEWQADKEARIAKKVSGLADAKREVSKKRLAGETEVNEARKAEFSKQKAEAQAAIEAQAAEKAAAKKQEEAKEEETKVEAKEESKAEAKEEPKVEAKEEPKAEAKEEPKVEAKEEPKAEAKEEPKAEAKEEPKADDAK